MRSSIKLIDSDEFENTYTSKFNSTSMEKETIKLKNEIKEIQVSVKPIIILEINVELKYELQK